MSAKARCLFYGPDPYEADPKNMAKVKVVDVHPVKPWVVSADERDRVIVWDYARKEVVKTFTPQDLQEQQRGLRDVQGAPGQVSAEQGGAFTTEHIPSRLDVPIREVRAVKFYDPDVLWWRCRCSLPTIADKTPEFIMVLTSTKLLLINPVTLECRHISPDQLSGAAPTSVEIMSSSWIGIGCADGCVRLWDWTCWTLVKVLRGHRDKGDVTHIVSTHLGNSWQPKYTNQQKILRHRQTQKMGDDMNRMQFVSVGSDAQVLMWDMQYTANDIKRETHMCQLDGLVKGDHVHDVTFNPTMDTLTILLGRRRTTQGDMRVVVWDLRLAMEKGNGCSIQQQGLYRLGRSLGSAGLVCLDHPSYPGGTMVSCAKDSLVHFVTASDKGDVHKIHDASVPEMISLTEESNLVLLNSLDLHDVVPGLPPRERKVVKVYVLQHHPVQQHLLICGSRVGVIVLSLQPVNTQMYAYHPLFGSTVLSCYHDGLSCMDVITGENIQSSASEQNMSPQLSASTEVLQENLFKPRFGPPRQLAKAEGSSEPADRAVDDHLVNTSSSSCRRILLHPSGRLLATVNYEVQAYTIYFLSHEKSAPGDDLTAGELCRGTCADLAWVGDREQTFAVLNRVKTQLPHAITKKGKEVAEEDHGVTLTFMAIASGHVIRLGMCEMPSNASTLHGGLLLGVGFLAEDKQTSVSAQGTLKSGLNSGAHSVRHSAKMEQGSPHSLYASTLPASVGYSKAAPAMVESQGSVQLYALKYANGIVEDSEPEMTPASPLMPEVSAVAWDWDAKRCALFSSNRVYIYLVNGGSALELLGSVTTGPTGEDEVTSMCWSYGTLYICTPVVVYAVYCRGDMVERVLLASHAAPADRNVTAAFSVDGGDCPHPLGSLRPWEHCRPPGFIEVMGTLRGNLLLCGPRAPFLLRLNQPSTRLGMLVCANEPVRALNWAKCMYKEDEEEIFLLLERWGYSKQC
ncbi:unnamed protein product [Choristocarpus tenellus]